MATHNIYAQFTYALYCCLVCLLICLSIFARLFAFPFCCLLCQHYCSHYPLLSHIRGRPHNLELSAYMDALCALPRVRRSEITLYRVSVTLLVSVSLCWILSRFALMELTIDCCGAVSLFIVHLALSVVCLCLLFFPLIFSSLLLIHLVHTVSGRLDWLSPCVHLCAYLLHHRRL